MRAVTNNGANGAAKRSLHEPWFNRTLTTVNDAVVFRLGVQQGELHWHRHVREDEFFLVIEGELAIEVTRAVDGQIEPASGLHDAQRDHAQDQCFPQAPSS
jgi:mannose-6-phosphate isomerase-like protein (cupin superfamily)